MSCGSDVQASCIDLRNAGWGLQGVGVLVRLLLVKGFLKVLEPEAVPSSVQFAGAAAGKPSVLVSCV